MNDSRGEQSGPVPCTSTTRSELGRPTMKIFLLILSAVLAATAIQSADTATAPTRLLRHPTYSNGKVAFSHRGDIWIANDDGSGVRRLTDHQARDVYPRFSPDGKWIAFSSARNGNNDVF